ncbi:TMEM175 family protein [Kitasatospora sp. NPDC088351]|uniref:TMEM175 family protein n=1 Tax=unclassified Kitasatospora TaxID=2633591 RepID=UPI00342B5F01
MSNGRSDEKSPHRLIALTPLVLGIKVPTGLDAAGFRNAVHDALPQLGACAPSFAILAGHWRDHRRILRLPPRNSCLPGALQPCPWIT